MFSHFLGGKMNKLTHIDDDGSIKMVDISEKEITTRFARGCGRIEMSPDTMDMLVSGKAKKGNVLETARLAGIMAAKKNSDLIPLCHPIKIKCVTIDFDIVSEKNFVNVFCEIKCSDATGAEMEALCGVSIACLTIYDMLKAVDKEMVIGNICLLEKSGGKTGHFIRK